MPTARIRSALLITGLFLVGACGSSSGPSGGGGGNISVNTVVSGTVSGSASNTYTIKFTLPIEFSVLFQVTSGSATLELQSPGGTRLATVGPGTPDQALGQNFSDTFSSGTNGEFRIVVSGDAQYRFEVYSPLPTPEHTAANIAIGDTVSEPLEAGTDVDNFHLTGAAGDELIAYLQALGTPGAGVVRLLLTGPGADQSVIASLGSPAGQSTLETNATPRFTLPAAGDYTVHVAADPGHVGAFNAFAGPYKFQIRRIQRAPEHAAASVAPGATVTGEAIDYVGDIDRFTIAGAPGQELNVFFQTANQDTTTLVLQISDLNVSTDPGDPLILTVQSKGTDHALTDHSSARFKLPANGHATIEVLAPTPFAGTPMAKGAYVFKVSAIDRTPETASPMLMIGDSVTTERIDAPGDIDEFSLTVPSNDTLNIMLELDPASLVAPVDSIGLPGVQVFSLAGQPAGEVGGGIGSPPTSFSGTYAIAPGQYVVRVADGSLGAPGFHSYSGPYRLHLFRIRSAPETAPAVIVFGDTVSESLTPSGDVDAFTFQGSKGDFIDVQLQGLGTPGGQIYFLLMAPGNPVPLALVQSSTASPSLGAARSGRILLPATGSYEIRILPIGGGTNPVEAAPYRLALLRLPTAPEVHSATLTVGELMTNEAVDSPDDVDEFTVHGAPGTEVVLLFRAPTLPATAEVLIPTTKDTIRTTVSAGDRGSTGRFLIPASGALLIRVLSPSNGTGLYELQLFPINRAPELTSATYVVGDTVSGEPIDVQGADIDEYRFNGTAGQKVVAYFQTPNGVNTNPGLILELVSPSTGQVLGSVVSTFPGGTLTDLSTGTITLPVSGQYIVRVRGSSDTASVAVYRFSVQTVP